jgi:hypothetical protein
VMSVKVSFEARSGLRREPPAVFTPLLEIGLVPIAGTCGNSGGPSRMMEISSRLPGEHPNHLPAD